MILNLSETKKKEMGEYLKKLGGLLKNVVNYVAIPSCLNFLRNIHEAIKQEWLDYDNIIEHKVSAYNEVIEKKIKILKPFKRNNMPKQINKIENYLISILLEIDEFKRLFLDLTFNA